MDYDDATRLPFPPIDPGQFYTPDHEPVSNAYTRFETDEEELMNEDQSHSHDDEPLPLGVGQQEMLSLQLQHIARGLVDEAHQQRQAMDLLMLTVAEKGMQNYLNDVPFSEELAEELEDEVSLQYMVTVVKDLWDAESPGIRQQLENLYSHRGRVPLAHKFLNLLSYYYTRGYRSAINAVTDHYDAPRSAILEEITRLTDHYLANDQLAERERNEARKWN